MFYFSWWKTMKSAWEPATELLNKDNFGPCRHIRLTSECSVWAKMNREKWSWFCRRSHYLFVLPDLQLETWNNKIMKLLSRKLSQLDPFYPERAFQYLITGADPCGWSLHVHWHVVTGSKGIIIEKQDAFSPNNTAIRDLQSLKAMQFQAKFRVRTMEQFYQ